MSKPVQIIGFEKMDRGFKIVDASQKIHECSSPSELWSILNSIAVDSSLPSVQTGPKRMIRKSRLHRRTTREQEEDLRKIGQTISNAVPGAGPAISLAGDFLRGLTRAAKQG